MKIRTNEEVKNFWNVINNCSNTVYLVTSKGEQYDLKTAAGWFKGVEALKNADDFYSEPEIYTNSFEDETLIARYILSNRETNHAA